MYTSTSYATAVIASSGRRDSAFALDLKVNAKAVRSGKTKISFKGYRVSKQVREAMEKVKSLLKLKHGVRIEIESMIPAKAGLGEDEAIAAAAAIALAAHAANENGSVNEVQIDKFLRVQFFEVDGKIIDKKKLFNALAVPGLNPARLFTSLFGGFAITEGKNILRRGEMEEFDAVILTSGKKNPRTPAMELVWELALKGDLYRAMRLNSSLCDDEAMADKMLKAGALTVATTGNSTIGLIRDSNPSKVENSVKRKGNIIRAKTSNKSSRVLRKPKKILRVNEFMKLKGEQDFYFL